jgi:hypothetical protein
MLTISFSGVASIGKREKFRNWGTNLCHCAPHRVEYNSVVKFIRLLARRSLGDRKLRKNCGIRMEFGATVGRRGYPDNARAWCALQMPKAVFARGAPREFSVSVPTAIHFLAARA